MESKTIFITGATSGIGMACAEKFAEAGHQLILCGRRRERLEQLRVKLEKECKIAVHTLTLDVSDRKAVEQAVKKLPFHWKKIDVLINNAGLAIGFTEFDKGNTDDWEQMIDTNLKGMLYVSSAVVPLMKEQGGGHIINIGSIAGVETYPKGNVYCATKHAVASLTKGMRMDLLPYGIKVSQVSPGATETEFSVVRFYGDKQRAADVYKGYQPLTGKDVAGVIFFVAGLPPHVNVNDLLLMPTAQASATLFNKNEEQ
ncbi:MAG: SDR family NAD(P)-dependent oxidoreductase [Bacteroidales bacterium]|nr:SDR family NAD(P)-dependent oxidoreductase [Bacteroidales bacterium]